MQFGLFQRRGISTAVSGNAGGAPDGLDRGGFLHLQRRIRADRQPGDHLSQAIATAVSAALVDGDERRFHAVLQALSLPSPGTGLHVLRKNGLSRTKRFDTITR